MIKKHPMNRAERLAINARHKKKNGKSGKSVEEISFESFRALPSHIEDRSEDNRPVH